MFFRPFEYMRWAKEHETGFPYFLAGSAVPPPEVAELVGSLDALRLDADEGNDGFPELKAAVAERARTWHARAARQVALGPEHVLLGQGSSYVNALIFQALVTPGAPVIVETPAYAVFDRLARLYRGTPVPFRRPPARGFALDLEALADCWSTHPGCRLLAITNLHNPSGAALCAETLHGLAVLAEAHDGYVLVDEVYLELAPDALAPPACGFGARLISTCSLTKSYGLGNARIGWAICRDAALMERLILINDLVAVLVSTVDQALAIGLFAAIDTWRAKHLALIARNRERLTAWAEARPDVRHQPAPGGPVDLLDLCGRDARAVSEHAGREHGLAIPPGDFFELPGWLRVGCQVASADHHAEALERLGLTLDAIEPTSARPETEPRP